jgi:transcriptional regulator with GAF, ATPase, and Fis domain
MSSKKNKTPDIIFKSAVMQQILNDVAKIAKSDANVLITGETGVGKDVIAQKIHEENWRKDNPFKAVNCASFNKELLQSELFGHEQGAFTGATKLRRGMLEQANRGTLFLDEIGDMPVEVQAEFLRVLETQEFTRVGGEKNIKVNVRIIAATNADLSTKIKAREFRPDLHFRLNTLPITIPPLRERREDIQPLVHLFISKLNKVHNKRNSIAPDVLSKLEDADWPGNIRHLRNVLERAVILAEEEELKLEDFPDLPGDPKSLATESGVAARGARKENMENQKEDCLTEPDIATFDVDKARKLWDFIWKEKPTFKQIDNQIFWMVYDRYLALNKENEDIASTGIKDTLSGITDYRYNEHKDNPPDEKI